MNFHGHSQLHNCGKQIEKIKMAEKRVTTLLYAIEKQKTFNSKFKTQNISRIDINMIKLLHLMSATF